MGTDIHMAVEVFNEKAGLWEHKVERGKCPQYLPHLLESNMPFLSRDLSNTELFEDWSALFSFSTTEA